MLTLLQSPSFRRAGTSAKGPEYQGPCPVCGGTDRFHVWPEQGEEGTWWCRQCGKGGDLIEFYRWRDGLSFRDACERAGRRPDPAAYSSAQRRASALARDSWTPAAPAAPSAQWSAHATKLAIAAKNRLQATPHVLDWLARRGIDAAAAYRYELGWLPTDEWRTRESWGLPTERKADGRAKRLWLPAGLLIPFRDPSGETGEVIRLRIRPDNPDLRYYIVPGSSREPLITMPAAEAWVVVESELDAIALAAACADMPELGVVAMGNSTARPTASLHADLRSALHISVALDNDPPKTAGGHDGPGAAAAKWWLERYPQARRTPPVDGKDPGEMFARGRDLREWVLAGLPPKYDHYRATHRQSLSVAPAPAPEPEPEPAPEPIPEPTPEESSAVAPSPESAPECAPEAGVLELVEILERERGYLEYVRDTAHWRIDWSDRRGATNPARGRANLLLYTDGRLDALLENLRRILCEWILRDTGMMTFMSRFICHDSVPRFSPAALRELFGLTEIEI